MRTQVLRRTIWCLLLGAPFTAWSQPANWQVLKFPGPAGPVDRTWCVGMSPRGDMVGYFVQPPDRGFALSGGVYSAIDVPGASWTHSWDVNARGDVIGDYGDANGIHGFLYSKGTITPINYPGVFMTHPRGISPNGDIVGGTMATSTSPWVGLLIDRHGVATQFSYPGAVSTSALGINAQVDIAGDFRDSAGKTHGFLRSAAGAFTQLDFPGATTTSAWKINTRGDIVGYYWIGSPAVSHGFLLKDGVYSTVDYPGATHTMIHGQNSEREMCGMVSFTPLGSPIQWGGFSRTW